MCIRDRINDDAVTSAKIAAGVVVASDIAADTITAAKIAAGAVGTSELAADSVTAAKIADDVLNSEHYVAASIDNEHLADDAVDSDELAAGAVDLAHLSASGSASSSTFLRGDNSWAAPGSGLTGGGTEAIFLEGEQQIDTSYAITSGFNAWTTGPVTVASGVTVTVTSGCTWTVG